jgi:hypothetical protein
MASSQSHMQVIDSEDGPITVVSLDLLRQAADTRKQRVQELSVQITSLQQLARDAQAKAGWILTTRQAEWQAGDKSARIEAARGMGQLVSSLSESVADVRARPHHGLGGLIQGVRDAHEARGVQHKLASASHELENRYRAVVDQLDQPTGITEADSLLHEAREAEARVHELIGEQYLASTDVDRMSEEIKRRQDLVAKVGFDALGAQADLMVNGIRPIPTSLVLKPKEFAAVETPAALCRFTTRTQFVGGSQGISIPLGHGFRYRVSSFRGHPVQSQQLSRIDSGKLVVTNKRLVFLGSKRDVSTPLAKVLQVEPYSDAIGIAREGKEARDIYLVSNPAYVVLYLQWVVGHQT